MIYLDKFYYYMLCNKCIFVLAKKEMKTYNYTDWYINIHRSIIQNTSKVKAIQMSINW